MNETTCNRECFEYEEYECESRNCNVDHTEQIPKFSLRLFMLRFLQEKAVWYVFGVLDCAIVLTLLKIFKVF